jgi:uncharacterized Zn finger protein
MQYGRWPAYVPVAKRRTQAEKQVKQLQKQGKVIEPIGPIKGRKITTTFWGEAWCKHLEKFSDFENRLPRGRTYVRNGSVCHLTISKGQIEAMVSGSSIYHIHIKIKALPKNKWKDIKKACAGQIGSMLELLQGRFSKHVMEIVADQETGLFPKPGEIKLACNCPDWADLCKHLAAVLYGVGTRLDKQPELLFLLRGVNEEELVDTELDIQTINSAPNKRRIADQNLGDIFNIDIEATPKPSKKKTKNTRIKTVKKKASTKTKGAYIRKTRKPLPRKTPIQKRSFPGTSASVKRLRKRLTMTPQEFACLVGVSYTSIINWEHHGGKLKLHKRTKEALEKTSCLTPLQAKRRLNKRLKDQVMG